MLRISQTFIQVFGSDRINDAENAKELFRRIWLQVAGLGQPPAAGDSRLSSGLSGSL